MDEHLVVVVVLGLLALVVVFIQVMAFIERRDLLNRLMARDLPELANFELEKQKLKKPVKIKKQEGIPI